MTNALIDSIVYIMNENTNKSQSYIMSGLIESGLRLCAYYGVWHYGDVLLQFVVVLLGLAEVIKLFKESLCDH